MMMELALPEIWDRYIPPHWLWEELGGEWISSVKRWSFLHYAHLHLA